MGNWWDQLFVLNFFRLDSWIMIFLLSASSLCIWLALMLIWKDYKKMSYREFGNYLIKGSYFITGYSYFLQNIKKIPLSLNLFISQMPIWKEWKSIDKSTPLKSTSEINLFNKNKKAKKRAEQISNIFKK